MTLNELKYACRGSTLDGHTSRYVAALEAEVARLEDLSKCTCEDLLHQIDTAGKALESSCEQHEWRLINRIICDGEEGA